MDDLPVHAHRFDGRALVYSNYRPTYPHGIIKLLENEAGLGRSNVVADIGSGTGILSDLILSHGNLVFCVEPNDEMREIAEAKLARHGKRFVSVRGSAESTTLMSHSVDLVATGQALHWFDVSKARREFRRVLRGRRQVSVIYNDRCESGPLEEDYERIVQEYAGDRSHIPKVDDSYVKTFLGKGGVKRFSLPNRQVLSFAGLLGRLASASYMPGPRDEAWQDLTRDVGDVMKRRGVGGRVILHYQTRVYLGRL